MSEHEVKPTVEKDAGRCDNPRNHVDHPGCRGGAMPSVENDSPGTTITLDVFTLERIRAEVWDRALDHVWALSDPAYTILACVDPARDESEAYLELVTLGDIGQAKRENPHRVAKPQETA